MRRAAPGLLLAAVLASHLPLLRAGYVQDDHVAVERGSGSGASILEGSYWEGVRGGDRSLYRPLTVASYAAERALFGGPGPAGSHAINLLLHAAVCWLIFSIALRLGAAEQAALLGALLFAVTPAKSEAVANIVGRAEILAALFTLGAIRCALARPGRTAAWGAALCVLAAAASKETGLVAAPLAALAAFLIPPRRSGREWAGLLLPMGLALTIFTVLRTHALEAFFPVQTVPLMDNPIAGEHGIRALATAVGLIARYARIVIVPWPLANDYSGASIAIETGLLAWRPLAGLAIVAGAVAVAWRGRAQAFAVAVAALPYFVIANLAVPVGAIFAERFLYLPVAGVTLLAALALDHAGAAWRRGALALVAVLAVLMVVRSMEWRSDASIFASTSRNNPKSPRAPFWLGSLAVEANRPHEAGARFDQAIANWPAFPSPWLERGLLAARAGDGSTAQRDLIEAIRLEPTWAAPRLNLALVLHRAGQRDAALRSARIAALWEPDNAKAWAEIGHLYFESGALRDAAGAYRRAVALGRADLAPRLAEAEGAVR